MYSFYKGGCLPAFGVQARKVLSPLHQASQIEWTCSTTTLWLQSLFCKSVLASQPGELFAGPQGWSDQGMLLARPENNFFFWEDSPGQHVHIPCGAGKELLRRPGTLQVQGPIRREETSYAGLKERGCSPRGWIHGYRLGDHDWRGSTTLGRRVPLRGVSWEPHR